MEEPRRLIHIISSNRWTGREQYALDVCRHFASRGWSVTAYTRDAKTVDTRLAAAGIDMRHAPLGGYLDPASVLLLMRDFKHEQPGAIIHVHRYRDAFTALAARRLAGRPDLRVVSTRHKVKRGVDSWTFRRIYRNLAAQIFTSKTCLDRFLSSWEREKIPFPMERVHVMLNSIMREEAPEVVPEPSQGPVIAMYLGLLLPGRGLETLIDALPRLRGKRIRLWIVGNGNPDYVDSLRRRAISRGVMDLIDWKRHTDTPGELIDACHFGVCTALSPEGFGMANLEFMAHSRPQVVTAIGAATEYVTDGREAILVKPGDTTAVADAMLRLGQDAELRDMMGERALQRYHGSLSWVNFARRLEEIYRETLR